MSEIKDEIEADNKMQISASSSGANETRMLQIKMFKCSMCDLYTKYEYFGTRPVERHLLNKPYEELTPDQQKERLKINDSIKLKKESIVLLENSYVCDDPFSVLKSSNYLVLGADCSVCKKMVCVDSQCSFFYYKKRFCLNCAKVYANEENESAQEFPLELRNEIVKIISAKSNDSNDS